MSSVPKIRIRSGNSLPVLQSKDFVLYWMTASRRTTWNFALDRAVEWAEKLRKPLVILEALRCGYPWASDRMHRFVIDGMRENACRFESTDVLYYPYLELAPNAGKGLLAALASRACIVVTDDSPASSSAHGRFRGSAGRSAHGGGGLEWPAPAAASRGSLSNRVCFSPVLTKGASTTFDLLSEGQCALERKTSKSKTSFTRDHKALAEGFCSTSEFRSGCAGRNYLGSRDSPGGDPRGVHGCSSTTEKLSAK